MPRLARVVVPGLPHHVVHRGNNRQDIFFTDDDRRWYLRMLKTRCAACGVAILGYCLMNNHVHLVLLPRSADALAHAVGRAHWLYAQYVNRLHGRSGIRFGRASVAWPLSILGRAPRSTVGKVSQSRLARPLRALIVAGRDFRAALTEALTATPDRLVLDLVIWMVPRRIRWSIYVSGSASAARMDASGQRRSRQSRTSASRRRSAVRFGRAGRWRAIRCCPSWSRVSGAGCGRCRWVDRGRLRH